MSLQFILGSSGSGKSRRAYQDIIRESMEHPEQDFLVIVPEQFSMQTQKELVTLHPQGGILNIDVLSFQRLAYRVFEETGADRHTVLEDTGKSLLLRKVAIEQQEQLRVLGGNLRKPGYIDEVKSVISELTQYNVGQEELDQMIRYASGRPGLMRKLEDIQVLYAAFREKLKEKYITSEEVLEVLMEAAKKSKLLAGCTILLDGFTGFTPIQQKVLGVLMGLARKMTVTITLDPGENPWKMGGMHELFYLSKKTVHILVKTAREAGCEIAEPVILGQKSLPRFADAPALAFLERHFLRPVPAYYKEEQEALTVHTAKNAVEEVRFAARQILHLVRREGYRYQDIAVITGDLASYGEYVRRIFGEYGIPCFIDETRTILLNPFIEYIRAALELAAKNFSYESVFRYLRTGLCGLEREEIDLLENYVKAAGKRGLKAWSEKWECPTRTMDAGQAAVCDGLRQRVVEPLLPFLEQMKGRRATGRERTQALYDLIVSQEIQAQLARYEQHFRQEGELDMAKEYSQIYGIVLRLLDKVVDLLGEESLSTKEYTEILEAGFLEAKVGIIPPTADRVLVGDIERTRLKDIRALIFLGLNDGWVPKCGGKSGILTELDRDSLEGCGVELAPGARENGYIQRFYLYQILTKPSSRLILSYGKMKTGGESLRPSYIVNRILRMYPGLQVADEDERASLTEQAVTPESGIPWLIRGLKDLQRERADREWAQLYSWYDREEAYRERLNRLVDAAFLVRADRGIGRQAARALYGEVLENSVTRLEQFAACAFSHFLGYGLRLSEREEYGFQPVDMGNVFHLALELFAQRVQQGSYTWFTIPRDIQEQWADECLNQAVEELGGEALGSTARSSYGRERMKRILRRSIWALCEQVRAGSFAPVGYEISFSTAADLDAVNISLTEKEKMRLRGRIDRVDTCETEDAVYVKVIDYKSGSTEFDLVALYYGLQLQLVVYLNAALELEKRVNPGKEVIPAGIFYYRMQDPILEREEKTPEEINEEILKKLRPSGLVNGEAVDQLDKSREKTSKVIPVGYTRSGFSAASSVAGREQFRALSDFVNKKMQEIGGRILAGETEAAPYERKGRTACDHCSFREVCGFDRKIPGNHYRRLNEWKNEEIWQKISEPKGSE